MNTQLLKQATARALGVYAYVFGVAWFMNNAPRFFGDQPTGPIGFSLVLLLFIVSALVTGSLVLWSPAKLLVSGKTKEAGMLLFTTGAMLAAFGILAAVILVLMR